MLLVPSRPVQKEYDHSEGGVTRLLRPLHVVAQLDSRPCSDKITRTPMGGFLIHNSDSANNHISNRDSSETPYTVL